MKKAIKTISLITALLMAVTMFSGCGNKNAQNEGDNDLAYLKADSSGEFSYPVKTDKTLKYWLSLNPNVSQNAPSINDIPFTEAEYERTGIKVEYIHPAQGQEQEKFNLLLTSNDMPDMIAWDWYNVSGGPEKAINDGFITRLNDILEYAPNLSKVLAKYPEYDKMVKTDEGSYYVFPTLKVDKELTVFYGPILRNDWLTDLGLSVPETLDEWYDVLMAFKNEKGADAPFSSNDFIKNLVPNAGGFIGAFGTKMNFYIEDGKVKYGVLDEGYKEFVKTFRKWYQDGLIDKNIASVDGKALDSKILNGNTGATFGYNGSSLGRWITSSTDESFDLVAAKYPVLEKGTKPKFGQKDLAYVPNYSVAISNNSKNRELAARFLDYAYGEEGHMLYNFGVEGESYTLVDGEPVYTDLILKNPENLSISLALGKYTHASYEGPFLFDIRYFRQFYQLKQQNDALPVWSDTDAENHLLPRIMPTSEESSELKDIMTEITPLVEQKTIQFIMGVEPLEGIDVFIEQLKAIGIEKAVSIQQLALDRYNRRK